MHSARKVMASLLPLSPKYWLGVSTVPRLCKCQDRTPQNRLIRTSLFPTTLSDFIAILRRIKQVSPFFWTGGFPLGPYLATGNG